MGVSKQFAMNVITSFNSDTISGKHLYFCLIKLLLLFTLPATILSCKVQKLEPELPKTQEIQKLNISIGYYHSPEFLSFKDSICYNYNRIKQIKVKEKSTYKTVNNKTSYKIEDIAYDTIYFEKEFKIFPLGISSDAYFKSIYTQAFKSARPVNATVSYPDAGIDFILKPQIVSFQFTKGLLFPNWAEIIYLFTLYSPDGKEIASWTTVGQGVYDSKSKVDVYRPGRNAIHRVMENAGLKFIQSFDHVPEVQRCLNNGSLEGVTVTPEMHDVIMSPQAGDSTFTNSYKGLVNARIKYEFVHKVPLKNRFDVMDTIGVAAFEIILRNEGSNRLYIDPLNISWRPLGQEEVYPVSPYVLMEDYVEIIYPTSYTDYYNDPLLDIVTDMITDMLQAYPDPMQQKEFLLRQKYFKREALSESTLNSNTSVKGSVYFPVSQSAVVSGVLEIPVIDLDTDTRYIIRFQLPIDTKTKEIKFTNQTQPAEGIGLGTF